MSLYRSVVQRSLLTFFAYIFAMCWNFAYHVAVLCDDSPPEWLYDVQLFWLGGAGFSSAIGWYPFIKRSLRQVGTDIVQIIVPSFRKVEIKMRRQVKFEGRMSSIESGTSTSTPLPVYRIPARWQTEPMHSDEL